jgi:hypothetical protein
MPYRLQEDPILAKLRKERVLDKKTASNRLKPLPSLANPYTEMADPNRE